MTLLIDNYDSFSYNLYQLVGELDPGIRVIRNDELTLDEIRALHPAHIILSPGPGRPEDAGITLEAARTLGKEIPTLGVCLGHQAICAAFGATVTYAKSSCTASSRRWNSTRRARCSKAAKPRCWWHGTTRWQQTPLPCRRSLKSPPAPPTAR